jgi:hypothetical protein
MNYFLTGVFLLACSYVLIRGYSMYQAFRDRDMTLIDRVRRGTVHPPIWFKLVVIVAFFGGWTLVVLSLLFFVARYLP